MLLPELKLRRDKIRSLMAQQNIDAAGVSDRVRGHAVDLLQATSLPGEADIWWMSQFLDCFSLEQITAILTLIRHSM